MALPQTTIVGNMVDDEPRLRYTPQGVAVANFRIAATDRKRQPDGSWADGDSCFITCNVWREMAENAAETFTKGMRIVAMGRLKQRSYETRDGEKRTVYELECDDCGPSIRNASAKVNKSNRSSGGGPSGNTGAGSGGSGDPWAADDSQPPF